MTTSPEIKNIAVALIGFHKEVGKIEKDSKNPFFKSSYASLSGILESIAGPLINNGLAVVQFPEGDTGLTTRLIHTSGEWMEATYQMPAVKNTPQDRGSAITYQRRYAIGAILSLNIDSDDDGNAASTPPKQQPANKPQPSTKEPVALWSLSDSALEELKFEVAKCENLDTLTNLFNSKNINENDRKAKAIFTERRKQLTETPVNA